MTVLRREYTEGLEDLRLQVDLMGAKVQRNADVAVEVLRTGDQGLADSALSADDDIDATNVSLTERCYELMAMQAPVAGDLRLLVSVVRVSAELERVGDLALRICKLAPEYMYLAEDHALHDLLCVMGDEARDAFGLALAAWSAQDADLAARMVAEPSVTRLHSEQLWVALTHLTGADAAAIAVRAALVGQALDRIADHARVIAARVRYLVTGEPEHLAAEVR